MIHNNFHNIHLNTAMSLSTVFSLGKSVAAGTVQVAALHKKQDYTSYKDPPAVHNKKTFTFPLFLKHIQERK